MGQCPGHHAGSGASDQAVWEEVQHTFDWEQEEEEEASEGQGEGDHLVHSCEAAARCIASNGNSSTMQTHTATRDSHARS